MRRFTRLTLSVLLLLSFLLSPALAVRPAYAAGIIVNTNADNTTTDGSCTLREAITNANNDAATYADCAAGSGIDTITFAANYTITLGSSLPDVKDLAGVGNGLTITGNGAANTIIQASTCDPITLPGGCTPATYRIIKIDGSSSIQSATFENMTFRYGGDLSGAGINNQAATLTLNNMTLTNNKIPSSSGLNGGGISINGGTTTINNSTISNNSIASANNSGNGNGSGIFVNTGALNISNSTISGNTAYNSGGGIYVKSGSTVTINNSTISGNTASNTSETTAGGGGLAQTGTGTVTLNNVTISGNSAGSYGAGLFINSGTLNAYYNTIANNNADSNSDSTGDGGGMYQAGGTFNLESSIVAGNKKATSTDNDCSGTVTSLGYNMTGSGTGCSLAGTGDVTVTASTVFTAVLDSSPSDNGGSTYTYALRSGSGAVNAIPNGTNSCGSGTFATDQRGGTRPQNSSCDIGAYELNLTRNVSTTGTDSGDCSISNCLTIYYAYSKTLGGETINVAAGTYTETAQIDMSHTITIAGAGASSTIVQAAASAGIANHRVFRDNGATVTLSGMTVRYGVETSGAGINNSSGALTLNNMIVSDNQIPSSSGLNGAGISVNGGTTTINNSTFSNNSINSASATTNGNGGGIFIGSSGSLTLNNVTVSGNTAYNSGGGVATKGGSVTINNSTISGNTATNTSDTTGGGGGLAQTTSGGTVNLNNVTVSGNSAKSNGAGLFMSAGTMNVNYSTIANNSADSDNNAIGDGGGVYRSAGTLNLKSSIVAGNKKTTSTNNDCGGTITTQGYNLTGSSTGCSLAGTGDMTVSPSSVFTSVLGSLANNGGSTYTHLLYGGNAAQDAIPSGTNNCGSGTFATDQIGNTRPYNSNCDIGAYESQDAKPTVSMNTSATSPTNTSPIPVTVTFNESVTGFTSTDITAGNATVSNFAGSGASYSFNLTPSSDGTVTADIAAGVAQDSVLNYNTAASQLSLSYDGTPPAAPVVNSPASSSSTTDTTPSVSGTAEANSTVAIYFDNSLSGSTTADASGNWTYTPSSALTANTTYTVKAKATDATGNTSVDSNTNTFTIDTTAPTISGISRFIPSGANTNASSVDFFVVFSESSLSGVDTSDFTLTTTGGISGASISSVTYSNGASASVTVNTGSGDGTIRLDVVDDDSITDSAGNKLGGAGTGNGNYTSGQTYTIDKTGPTVTMSSTASNPTSTSPIPVTVTFSESVTGFTSGDITAGNATVGNFAGSGTTYTFDLTPSGNGAVTADIAAGVAQDSAGNGNTAATQFSRTYDSIAPTVTSFTATSPSASFNIPITTFTATDAVSVTGYLITESAAPPSAGAAGWSASAPTSYSVAGDGSYTLYPWAKDTAGNVSAVYNSPASVTVETTAPSVISSVRANASPTNAASVDFIVTFSEGVSGVDSSDFSLTTGAGLTGASITGVSGGTNVYTVSVTTGSGSGTLRLDVDDDDSIADSAGNQLGGSGATNGNFSTGQSYAIDKIAPTAGSLVAPNITLSGSATYTFTVSFSDNLALDSTSFDGNDIRVTGPGGFDQLATFVSVAPSGNGTPRAATYQITAPGGAWDGADRGTYTVTVEANQIFDSAGNSVGATSLGSFLVNLNYTIYLPLVR
jgi:CSLREA domain-containing protein